MGYDAVVISAHPDDAETQMGGTLAILAEKGQRVLLVDLTEGEPTEFARAGVRAEQASEAARLLGVERLSLGLQDRFLADTSETRLRLAHLLRASRPRWVYRSIFQAQGDHLLTLYEAEDRYYGRLLGVAYAEIFRSAALLLVEDPTVFLPVSQG